jgi:ArsR family transcriptional regulator
MKLKYKLVALVKKIDREQCGCQTVHEEVVRKVEKVLPTEETLLDLADWFKVLGDATRVKILCALQEAPLCGCDLAVLLKMTKSAISHQLRILRQTRLVKYRREGKVVYYCLDDKHVSNVFAQGLEHVSEKK